MAPPSTLIRILLQRVESRWNQPQPGNHSLFRSKAPFSGNNNNLSLFWSPDLIRLEGTPTTHPHSGQSNRETGKEQQQSTGAFVALPLRSNGTTSTHSDSVTAYCSAWIQQHRPIRILAHQIASFGTNNNDSCGLPSAPKHQSEGPTHYSDSATLYRSA